MKKLGHNPKNDPWYWSIYQANKRLIRIMPDALAGTTEPDIDSFAGLFLTMCGFADDPLMLQTQQQYPFGLFGCRCECKPEHLVIITPNNDLVLVIEEGTHETDDNKHLFVGGSQPKFRQYHGYVGQVLGEMLMAASLNAHLPVQFGSDGKKYKELCGIPDGAPTTKRFHNIYAFRFAGLHLTGFRLDVSKKQMTALGKGVKPEKKLLLRTTVADPASYAGWDLTKKSDRISATALAAAVLQNVTK